MASLHEGIDKRPHGRFGAFFIAELCEKNLKEDLMNRSKLTLPLGALLALCLGVIAAPASPAASGHTTFEGEAPGRSRIRMSADPVCEGLHERPVGTQDYLIRPTGEIVNVFVYIKDGVASLTRPRRPGVLDQVGCMYEPHVQGIMVEQPLNIVNSDNTMHNVHCMATVNREFNFGQPTPGTREQVFRRAENAIPFKCDVHPWMSAYVFVMDHPYFAVSDSNGQFTIDNVPAGTYTLVAWHEKLGEIEQEITVGDGGLDGVTFTFQGPSKQ
jgi:hypothetical protein